MSYPIISEYQFNDVYGEFGEYNSEYKAKEIQCYGCESPILESEKVWINYKGEESTPLHSDFYCVRKYLDANGLG